MSNRRFCFACDLKDNPKLIEEYKHYHQSEVIWPEIIDTLAAAGITHMNIFLTGNRLFMIMDVDASFDMERKVATDASNPKVQEWETLMWKYQQAVPWAAKGEKWTLMEDIFNYKRQEL